MQVVLSWIRLCSEVANRLLRVVQVMEVYSVCDQWTPKATGSISWGAPFNNSSHTLWLICKMRIKPVSSFTQLYL